MDGQDLKMRNHKKTGSKEEPYELGTYGLLTENGEIFDKKNKKYISVSLRDDGIYLNGELPECWEVR